jgi:hypothetical protein
MPLPNGEAPRRRPEAARRGADFVFPGVARRRYRRPMMATPRKKAPPASTSRAAALAAMAALDVAAVARVPSYRGARASWLRGLLVPLQKDRAGLLDAPLDAPLSEEEVAIFPALVELVAETVADQQAESTAAVLTPTELALLTSLRGHQAKLDRAFRVRLRADRAGLRLLAEIRRGVAHDPEDALHDARHLVALASSAQNAPWIAALKKGEPAAVAALRAAVPTLEALATRLAGTSPGRVSRDQMRRAWTVALRLADRIVTAGQYYTGDLAGRAKDYRRFRPPTARRSRATKPATPA